MLKSKSMKSIAIGLCGAFAMAASALPAPHDGADLRMNTGSAGAVPTHNNAPIIHPHASESREPVGASLVNLFDISGSVDNSEYAMHITALSSAIESEDFCHAIFHPAGPQALATMLADFGTTTRNRIGWLDIREDSAYKLNIFADDIRAMDRREHGMTYQVRAYDVTRQFFAANPWPSKRNIVDMHTDGKENQYRGESAEEKLEEAVRRLAEEHGATINVLVTYDPNGSTRDLPEWSWDHLTTKPIYRGPDGHMVDGGFVKIVATEDSNESQSAVTEVGKAMEMAYRRKLVLEVAGQSLEDVRAHAMEQRQNGTYETNPCHNPETGLRR